MSLFVVRQRQKRNAGVVAATVMLCESGSLLMAVVKSGSVGGRSNRSKEILIIALYWTMRAGKAARASREIVRRLAWVERRWVGAESCGPGEI